MKLKPLLAGFLLIILVMVLSACGTSPPTKEATSCPESEICPDCPEVEPCPDCPECPGTSGALTPFEIEWSTSPHNDIAADAFRFWDDADPREIPPECAKCHSTPGYIAFMGADGSQFGSVESPAPLGTTIECVACHNDATIQHDSVVFPSGLELNSLGDQARCLECHQGRASKTSVDESITNTVGIDLDTPSENLGFENIHYYAAAATRFGTEVKGGYEYDGLDYDPRFDHVQDYQSCIDCHDMHTLKIKIDECAACHLGAASLEDIRMIRITGSMKDYDGDGDIEEPIRDEIAGLQELLYQNIQAYANQVVGTPIAYNPGQYPYFFIDANGDGAVNEDEGSQYNAWTGRLLKAAYNFQVSQKDPGAYAHGGKYIIQLLYDSLSDLNSLVAVPVDMTALHRQDSGHFAASRDAWRHWDQNGEISAGCSKCHSAEGLPNFIATGGETRPQPVTSGLLCTTCHDDLVTFSRYISGEVEFPSGARVTFEDLDANLCLKCHQGREATPTINSVIDASGAEHDDISPGLEYVEPHYFAAATSLFGTETRSAYEYDGQTYNGRFLHVRGYQTCIECHDTHQLRPKFEECTTCHGNQSAEQLKDIRLSEGDYDGDGDSTEGIAGEITSIQEALLQAITGYSTQAVGTPIAYDPLHYPYWFVDTNRNGMADPDETNHGNRFNSWTPRLLRAVYNYTWSVKDPGGYAHNGWYILQALYDSLRDIGGDVSAMSRPPTAQ